MKYLFLGLAICLEVLGTSCLARSENFTKWLPSFITILAFSGCFYCFSHAIKEIPLGVAYAIWAGLGIVLTALVSVFFFKQKLDLPALLGIAIIIIGVLVINLFSKSSAH
ncbi:DMT family transporter [Epilithonimonas vandammei]|uniref:DMT family transporter n=1 Tax=Epilithonimonas vandammei TaxID=2487072 RepID=UPI0028974B6D|nr:multidrug efflux SMR transporter [Epilithonimonas vandammei]